MNSNILFKIYAYGLWSIDNVFVIRTADVHLQSRTMTDVRWKCSIILQPLNLSDRQTAILGAKIVINIVWTFACVTCTLFYSLELISFKPVIIQQKIRIIMYINVHMTYCTCMHGHWCYVALINGIWLLLTDMCCTHA